MFNNVCQRMKQKIFNEWGRVPKRYVRQYDGELAHVDEVKFRVEVQLWISVFKILPFGATWNCFYKIRFYESMRVCFAQICVRCKKVDDCDCDVYENKCGQYSRNLCCPAVHCDYGSHYTFYKRLSLFGLSVRELPSDIYPYKVVAKKIAYQTVL